MTSNIHSARIIPVVEIDDAELALPLGEALLAGGIDIIEVTLRTAAAERAICNLLRSLPELTVGAGTVLSSKQAESMLDAGVQFGVSPGLNPEIVREFQRREVPFLPGVLTPTEIESAVVLGCRYLKFFPAEASGGISYLRALSGPYASAGVRFCATGGVTLQNMNDYLALPVLNAIGGSWIAGRQQIAAQAWSQITNQALKANERLSELTATSP